MQATLHEGAVLGEKMKLLEKAFSLLLPARKPFVARLDGVSFKRFTSGMAKPFDPRFTKAMIQTANDLLDRSSARTAFCQSDEITLVFGAEESSSTMYYGGRVSKIESVLASIATARFNYHLSRFSINDWAQEPPAIRIQETINLVNSGQAFFDARVFSVPDDKSAMEALYWRHRHDCRRNVVNSVGFHIFGHNRMNNMAIGSVLGLLREEKNIDPMEDYPPEAMLGVFLKKIQYNGAGFNPMTNEQVPCVRTRVEGRTFDWEAEEEERTAVVMDKFWQPGHPKSNKTLV